MTNPNGLLNLKLDKIIAAKIERAFEAFANPVEMSRWFTTSARAELTVGGRYSNADGDHGEFLALDPPKTVEFTWENERHCPGTIVKVTFSPQAAESVIVTLEHSKLRGESEYEDMKAGWSWALDSFKSYVETGKPIRYEDWERKKEAG